jgi:glyoxylase-like metal-dependent hydrolase (beta-lactamase superfamily II)
MLFRQFFDRESSSYTYLLADEHTREAAIVDPVLENVDAYLELMGQLGLGLVRVFDTHVHADHVTGASVLRERTGARTVSGHAGAACADLNAEPGAIVRVGGLALRVLATPGHTDDSVSYLLVDPVHAEVPGDRVFTGDALLIRAAGRTDFQNGDAGTLFDSITRQLFTLPDATLVYPGHDYHGRTVTTVGEEKKWNPRIAGHTRAQFMAEMHSLQLPAPKRMSEAVPANLACGRTPHSPAPLGPRRAGAR